MEKGLFRLRLPSISPVPVSCDPRVCLGLWLGKGDVGHRSHPVRGVCSPVLSMLASPSARCPRCVGPGVLGVRVVVGVEVCREVQRDGPSLTPQGNRDPFLHSSPLREPQEGTVVGLRASGLLASTNLLFERRRGREVTSICRLETFARWEETHKRFVKVRSFWEDTLVVEPCV